MKTTIAIMQRELLALFCSPIGYTVIAGFLLITGVLMLMTEAFAPGKPATLREVFGFTPYVLAIIIPAISMRLLSEEYRNGTIETVMTAPVMDSQLVIGKYLAALVFYVLMIASTIVYLFMLMMYGKPDLGVAFSSYLGLLLAGAALVAVGTFTSSLTANQIVAWMLAMVPLLLFVWFAQAIIPNIEGVGRDLLQTLNLWRHLDQFNRGLVTLESLVFFVGLACLFLFSSIKVVESRRWR